jgi:hypothetical protein
MPTRADIARRCLEAVAARDLDIVIAMWASGRVERMGQNETSAPKTMNAYLIEDEGDVTMFDAGIEDRRGPVTLWAGRAGPVAGDARARQEHAATASA